MRVADFSYEIERGRRERASPSQFHSRIKQCHLFDDEVVFIVAAIVGSAFVLIGLVTSPPQLQLVIEIGLVLALFNVCTKCIERGDRS